MLFVGSEYVAPGAPVGVHNLRRLRPWPALLLGQCADPRPGAETADLDEVPRPITSETTASQCCAICGRKRQCIDRFPAGPRRWRDGPKFRRLRFQMIANSDYMKKR